MGALRNTRRIWGRRLAKITGWTVSDWGESQRVFCRGATCRSTSFLCEKIQIARRVSKKPPITFSHSKLNQFSNKKKTATHSCDPDPVIPFSLDIALSDAFTENIFYISTPLKLRRYDLGWLNRKRLHPLNYVLQLHPTDNTQLFEGGASEFWRLCICINWNF